MTPTRTFKRMLAIAGLAAVAACSTSTPYEAAGSNTKYGFSDQRIEENRYRVSFKGNSLTDRETVENYLLYRSAELTVEAGYDYFIVVEDDTEKSTTYTGTRDPFFYGRGRPFPYYGWGYRWDPFYDDVNIQERNRYTAMAYIVMGKGEKPAEPTAYDARQVIENLGPVVVRPTAE